METFYQQTKYWIELIRFGRNLEDAEAAFVKLVTSEWPEGFIDRKQYEHCKRFIAQYENNLN